MPKSAHLLIEPRGLSERAAAAYVGVSVISFVDLVAKGKMPVPSLIGGHLLWDRVAIDQYFDAESSDLQNMEAWRGFLTKVMQDNPVASGLKQQPAPNTTPTGPKRRGPIIKTIDQLKAGEWYGMSEEEREKVKKKSATVFGRQVRAEPMNKLERIALWELYRRRGEKVHVQQMHRINETTQDRLVARGYARVGGEKGRYWQITEKGIEALKTTQEEPPPKVSKIWY